VRLLYLTDRLSDRGGADHHLAQVISDGVGRGHQVTVAFGRDEGGMDLPDAVRCCRVPGLAGKAASRSRLGPMDALLNSADAVHIQNVMNPVALRRATSGGRAVVTVQDHRVFCPGRGKTLPDGSSCTAVMADEVCRDCLPDDEYRRSTIELTWQRLNALQPATVVVLSQYMAAELATAGCGGARVIPPWIEVGKPRARAGSTVILGGRLVTHKGVVDGWRAWDAAARPLPLEVAGSGPLSDRLEGAKLLGWMDRRSLHRALRRARVLLFPSAWQEPFGILGVEALAQGTPVVVFASGGTADWSDAGCVRIPTGDVAAMARAVGELAADPGAALALGRAGQVAVGRRFARARIVAELEEVYGEVAGT
jgi:glycosyltransferase involved in cell wall biosynthesis